MNFFKQKYLVSALVLGAFAGGAAVPAMAQSTLAQEVLPHKTILEQNAYQYESREPCQGYDFGVKRLGVDHTCQKHEKQVMKKTFADTGVFKSYTVYFDLNSSDIRSSERATLDRVAREIATLQPTSVTVVGHADASGPADYNRELSSRRANSVSSALTSMGVKNRVINEKAKGEEDLAVPTPDGVKLQENRRVTIQFRK